MSIGNDNDDIDDCRWTRSRHIQRKHTNGHTGCTFGFFWFALTPDTHMLNAKLNVKNRSTIFLKRLSSFFAVSNQIFIAFILKLFISLDFW